MVKVGGKRNTHEVYKKQVNFLKTGENLIWGNNNFRETGGKCRPTETGKIGGNSKFVVDDYKKGHPKFLRMKTETFFGKR